MSSFFTGVARSILRAYFQHFPIERGKWTVWTKVRGWRFAQVSGRFRCRAVEGYEIEADASDTIGFHLYYWGAWEPNEAHVIRRMLKPGGTFLDVGANIGVFTLQAARVVGPSGHVIAIEATPDTAARLAANLKLNDARHVVVHQLAVSDKPGVVSINRRFAGNIGSNQISTTVVEGEETIPCSTIDALVGEQPIDFVKMDIEGAELLAVRGMQKILARPNGPDVMLEVTPSWLPKFGGDADGLIDLFEANGYGYRQVGDRRLTPVDRDAIRRSDQILLFFSKDRAKLAAG